MCYIVIQTVCAALLSWLALVLLNALGLAWIFSELPCYHTAPQLFAFQVTSALLYTLFGLYLLYLAAVHIRYRAQTGRCGACCACLVLPITYKESVQLVRWLVPLVCSDRLNVV